MWGTELSDLSLEHFVCTGERGLGSAAHEQSPRGWCRTTGRERSPPSRLFQTRAGKERKGFM